MIMPKDAHFITVLITTKQLSVHQWEQLKDRANAHGIIGHGLMWFTLLQDAEIEYFERLGIRPIATVYHRSNGEPLSPGE